MKAAQRPAEEQCSVAKAPFCSMRMSLTLFLTRDDWVKKTSEVPAMHADIQ